MEKSITLFAFKHVDCTTQFILLQFSKLNNAFFENLVKQCQLNCGSLDHDTRVWVKGLSSLHWSLRSGALLWFSLITRDYKRVKIIKMSLKPTQNGDDVLRKGPWMLEEDEILVEYVRQFGARDWSSIRSKGLLPRTGKSCRLRWVNKLKPDLKRYLLFNYHNNGHGPHLQYVCVQ